MATTLTHQHHQLQQLQSQHNIIFPHQIPSQTNSQLQNQIGSPGHLCKDCNMLFESSTSLEVHLSYHKENLLTKWGTSATENMENKTHLHSHPPASSPHNNHRVHIDVPTSNNNSSRPPSSSEEHGQHPPHYFPSVETHGHYLISQYNNNTGDHHLEPAFRPGAPNFGHPPVDPHGHLYASHNNIHHSPYPPLAPGQNQIFSPNSTQNNSSNGQRTPQPPPSSNSGGPGGDPPVGSREAAEILDLDSHKVHIYQQQQQQLAERNFFHRPYLSHLLPPQPSNGWPPGHPAEHQFVNNHGHSTAPFPGEHQTLPGGAYPPPSNTNGPRPSIPYDLGSNDLPNSAYPSEPPTSMGYPPLPHPSQHHLSQTSNFGSSLPGAFPPGPPPTTINGDSESNTPSARRTPPEGRGANKSAVKTKGWKGVDAKRPKTYNCTACNKWFTSSGHLKRHYGTTLHKNSIKQKGGVMEEKPPVTKKGGKKSPGEPQHQAGSDSMHSSSSSSPGRMNIKIEDAGRDEKSTSNSYGVPSSAANNGPNSTSNRSGGEGNPSNPAFNPNLNNSPPVPVPSPNSPYNTIPGGPSYLPYSAQLPNSNNSNNSHSQPPPPHQYSIPGPGGQFHPSPATPYMNGFVSDSNPPGSYNVAPPLFVPTTIYNGGAGNYSSGVDGDSTPLPPFSSVGFSHYDPNSFQIITSSPNNPNPSAFPPNPSPNRVTPPYQNQNTHQNQQQQQQQQHPMGSTPSPANNNNANENHHSMESVRSNRRGSPDDFRYHPPSGSNEGSLDGVENSEPERDSPSSSSSSESNAKEGPDNDTGDALKCPDCSKTFMRACYLTQHANSSHSGGKPFKCNSCGKRFSAEPALTEHIAKHGEEKPYKCKLCPKQFNHKTDLRRHNCLHTGEKPFVCHICQKGFIRKDHMTKHCETHLRKKGSSS